MIKSINYALSSTINATNYVANTHGVEKEKTMLEAIKKLDKASIELKKAEKLVYDVYEKNQY